MSFDSGVIVTVVLVLGALLRYAIKYDTSQIVNGRIEKLRSEVVDRSHSANGHLTRHDLEIGKLELRVDKMEKKHGL